MDFKRIEQLLEKYWECQTSLEEEKELKQFFNGPHVPEHLMRFKPLFVYFTEENQVLPLDELFDDEVLKRIQDVQAKPEAKKGKVITWLYELGKVAAVVLVLVTAGYFVKEGYIEKKDTVEPYLTDTFEDPKAAFEETKKALKIISANFNKGRKEARKLATFNEAQELAKNPEEKEM